MLINVASLEYKGFTFRVTVHRFRGSASSQPGGTPPGRRCGRPCPPWVQRTVFELGRHPGRSSSRTVAVAQKPAFTRTGGSDLIMTAADRFVGIDISQGRLDVAVTPGDQTLPTPIPRSASRNLYTASKNSTPGSSFWKRREAMSFSSWRLCGRPRCRPVSSTPNWCATSPGGPALPPRPTAWMPRSWPYMPGGGLWPRRGSRN